MIKNNDLTIQYSLTQSSNATLEIYNMLGRKIHTESFKYAQNGGKININKVKLPNNLTTNWPIGVYFIIVHDGKTHLQKESLGLNNWEKLFKSAKMRPATRVPPQNIEANNNYRCFNAIKRCHCFCSWSNST